LHNNYKSAAPRTNAINPKVHFAIDYDPENLREHFGSTNKLPLELCGLVLEASAPTPTLKPIATLAVIGF
jgi:hypothetical protein